MQHVVGWEASVAEEIRTPFALRCEEVREATRYAWVRLREALGLVGPDFLFTGLCSLAESTRNPLFKHPGVWIAVGPYPDFPVLDVRATQDIILNHLWACLRPEGRGGFRWAWDDRSDPAPTYVAALAMEDYWTFAPSLESALAHRLLPHRPMVEGLPCRRARR